MLHPSTWLAYITLSTSALTLPVYVLLVTLFLRNPHLKENTAYWLLANIGILDCFFLVATVHTSVMTVFATSPINVILFEFTFAMHRTYMSLLNLHMFLLALNRVAVIFELKLKHERIITKIASLFVWTMAIPQIAFHRLRWWPIEYRDYSFEYENYRYPINSVFVALYYNTWNEIQTAAIVLTTLCHLIVVAVALVKKLQFHEDFRIESENVRIHIQAFAMFIPGLLCWALVTFIDPETYTFTPEWKAFDILVPRLIPTMNALICVALNRKVRSAFIVSFKPASERNEETEQNVIATTEEQSNVDPKCDIVVQQA